MSGSELLIRHAAKWAEKRSAPFDAELLETALELRSFHDNLAANRWPEGSVEHLMLMRWPAHGPSGVPDVAALVESLESFWKFLANTGRMARGSADVRVLRAEARRAAPEMAAAAADTGRHSQSKVLTDFGREIGISLDEAESMEDLQDKLDRITQAWNDLPQEERFRRSPPLPAQGVRVPDEDDDVAVPADPDASAPHWLRSGYCRSLTALVEWVGDGREVTAAGLLRPAVARDAYRELDLWEWERGYDPLGLGETPDPEANDLRREIAATWWRSAGDCLALARLWSTMVVLGLVEVGSKRAIARRAVPTAPAQQAVEFGLLTLAHLAVSLRESLDSTCVGFVIFSIALAEGPPPTRGDLAESWWDSPSNRFHDLRDTDGDWVRLISDRTVEQCLQMFGDCGLWVEDGDALVGTEFGWDFALMLVNLFNSDLLDPGPE